MHKSAEQNLQTFWLFSTQKGPKNFLFYQALMVQCAFLIWICLYHILTNWRYTITPIHTAYTTLAWPIVLPWNPVRHRWIWWLSPRLKFHAKVCVHGHQGQPFPGAPSPHCESESVGRPGWAEELEGHIFG